MAVETRHDVGTIMNTLPNAQQWRWGVNAKPQLVPANLD
jgi:hypothetical protein